MAGVTVGDPCLDAKSLSTGFYGALWRSERVMARPIGLSEPHTQGIMERSAGKDLTWPFPAFPHRNRFRASSWRDRRRSGSCRSSASWPRGAKAVVFVSWEESHRRRSGFTFRGSPFPRPLSPVFDRAMPGGLCIANGLNGRGVGVDKPARPALAGPELPGFRRFRPEPSSRLPTPARTEPLHDQAERLRDRVQRSCWAVSPQVYQ